jgi:hypothetical protein
MQTSTKRLARYRRKYAEHVKDCRKSIAKFCDELKADPYHAFEWGTGPCDISAQLRVAQHVVTLIDQMPKSGENALTPDERIRKLYQIASHEARRLARTVPRSSDLVSNIAAQFLAASWVEVVEDLQWAIDSLDEEE